MCDIRLFRSALMDYETAVIIWRGPYSDEMILNNSAYQTDCRFPLDKTDLPHASP